MPHTTKPLASARSFSSPPEPTYRKTAQIKKSTARPITRATSLVIMLTIESRALSKLEKLDCAVARKGVRRNRRIFALTSFLVVIDYKPGFLLYRLEFNYMKVL